MRRGPDRGRADPGQEQGARPLASSGASGRWAGSPRWVSTGRTGTPQRHPRWKTELVALSRATVERYRRALTRWPLWPMTIVGVGPTTDVHRPDSMAPTGVVTASFDRSHEVCRLPAIGGRICGLAAGSSHARAGPGLLWLVCPGPAGSCARSNEKPSTRSKAAF